MSERDSMPGQPRIALLGRFPGDICVRVVDVGPHDTMEDVARVCADLAVDRTVRHPDPRRALWVRPTTPDDSAAPLPPGATVAEVGFQHFECVDVFVPDVDVFVPDADLLVPDVNVFVPDADRLVPDADVFVPDADRLVPDAD